MNTLFHDYTRSRYEKNKKIFSFQYVASPATLFEYAGSCEGLENVPPIADSAIGKLVMEVFSFDKYDATHPYAFRKKTPSARSIHPFLPVIHYHGFLFLYDANCSDFIYFGYNPARQDTIELVICADLWRICSVYGEFGIPLSLLELGHLLSDMKWFMNDDGCLELENGSFPFLPYHCLAGSGSMLNANDLYAMSLLKITELDDCIEGYTNPSYPIGIKKKYNYLEELHALGIDHFFAQAKKGEIRFPKPYHQKISDLPLKRRQRHSLNKRQGTFHLGPVLRTGVFKSFLSQMNIYTKEWLSANVTIYFFIYHIEGIPRGVYQWEGADINFLHANIDIYSIFYEAQEFMNLDTLPFLTLITVKDEENQSLSSFIESHIHAGEIVHTMSLLYAGEDTFTRPFKNINDAYCQKVCQTKENEYFIYGCLFGFGEKRNGLRWR
ncbi:hypothetical protein J9303_01545 [Bacillaceae bacterium Marseille-Q3522]|nr:hypothetical protein [Bacillaceae bacterium Marseille-Q3522]